MKFIADGFTIVDGVKDVIVPVGPGQQYPTVTVTLRAQRDAQLDAQRTLTVMYLVGNDFRGEVSRTVTVVEGGVLPADDGQEANPTGNTGSSTSIDVRPDPLEPGATLTLRLLKWPHQGAGIYRFEWSSARLDLSGLDHYVDEDKLVDLGDDPANYVSSLARSHRRAADTTSTLRPVARFRNRHRLKDPGLGLGGHRVGTLDQRRPRQTSAIDSPDR